jgi:4-hydroxybenzoate polyprenyltransferase
LAAGVFTWTAGFDIIYAIQDVAFDHRQKLYSLPSRIGIFPALWISRSMHLVTIIAWAAFNILVKAHLLSWIAFGLVVTILIKEQWVVRNGSLENIDYAFFALNSFIGIIFFLGHMAEWIIQKFNH